MTSLLNQLEEIFLVQWLWRFRPQQLRKLLKMTLDLDNITSMIYPVSWKRRKGNRRSIKNTVTSKTALNPTPPVTCDMFTFFTLGEVCLQMNMYSKYSFNSNATYILSLFFEITWVAQVFPQLLTIFLSVSNVGIAFRRPHSHTRNISMLS